MSCVGSAGQEVVGAGGAAVLEIRLLGSLEVWRDGVVVRLPGRLLPALLSMLALAAGRPIPLDTLAERLWPDNPPRDPRATLHTYVSRLRGLLGGDLIGTDGDNYVLQVEPTQVDALRMRALIRQASGRGEREQLIQALELWRGDPFVRSASEWLSGVEAPRLIEEYLTAVERRIDLDLEAGQYVGLIQELQELTARHPLRESLWACRIRALGALGRSAEALDLYGTVRAVIARELGVEPGTELQRIHHELLAKDATTINPVPERAVPRQLPLGLGRFVGRAGTLAALDAALADRASQPIAAVHGPGGIGKSSVVVHWAYGVRELFPDGQLFVDLRGHGPDKPVTPAAALDGLLRSLGIPGERIPGELGARSALLRSTVADRRILMVLDNARDSAQVRPLLPGPGPLVIVTSRNQLRGLAAREGARRIRVDRLTLLESVALLRAALPGRSIPSTVLTELARLCDGLPLALAIIAEQLAVRSDAEVPELVVELGDRQARLDVLDNEDDPLSSVRAALTTSYDVLDPSAGRLFRLLGVHAGNDIGASAAVALAGTDAAEDLDRLVDAHLVERCRAGRYRLHDLVALFAADMCTDLLERDAALERLDNWYVHSAAAAIGALGHRPDNELVVLAGLEPMKFADCESALAWFAREEANLIAAVRRAGETGRHQAAYGIAHQLWLYLAHQHRITDALELQELGLAAAEAAGDDRATAISLSQLVKTFNRAGRYAEVLRAAERALGMWRQLSDQTRVADVLASLCMTHTAAGRPAEAIRAAREGLAHARQAGAVDQQVRLLNNLASSQIALQRYDLAVADVEEAFALLPHPAADWLASYLWDTAGQAYAGQEMYDKAVSAHRTALAHAREVGDRWAETATLYRLGQAEEALGAREQAREHWIAAVQVIDESDAGHLDECIRADLVDMIAGKPPPARKE